MKLSTKCRTIGLFHRVKGKLKEIAGGISDNVKLEADGNIEKITGKVHEKIGRVNKVLGK
ncbi:MAG: CsbD family protein [Syntrophaceae bacterium]